VAKRKNTKSKKRIGKTSSIRKRKQNRRQRSKYPALDPSLNLRSRTELLDYDYLHKLDEKELEWLNKFTEEYVNANINTEKPKKNLHRNKALRKDCYDRNNARNRDIITRQKASNRTVYLEDILEKGYDEQDRLNARVELKKLGVLDDNGYPKKKKRTITF
jgi:hypothetical protein